MNKHTHTHTYIYIIIHHHHHHVVSLAWISLTLPRHFSLSFITSGKSSSQHPVSSHSCSMYVRAGRPTFARPYAGVHRIYIYTYIYIYIYIYIYTCVFVYVWVNEFLNQNIYKLWNTHTHTIVWLGVRSFCFADILIHSYINCSSLTLAIFTVTTSNLYRHYYFRPRWIWE